MRAFFRHDIPVHSDPSHQMATSHISIHHQAAASGPVAGRRRCFSGAENHPRSSSELVLCAGLGRRSQHETTLQHLEDCHADCDDSLHPRRVGLHGPRDILRHSTGDHPQWVWTSRHSMKHPQPAADTLYQLTEDRNTLRPSVEVVQALTQIQRCTVQVLCCTE